MGRDAVDGELLFSPCPIRDVLDRIGDQWSVLVLEALEPGTLRFNALKRQIGDISQHMLARTLKRLEQDGLVSRTLYPVIPPRVDYALTPLGHSLLIPLRGLIAWADNNHAAVCAARRAYRDTIIGKAAC
ncbi:MULTISPECIES: helix-turn-helix domain-containing protein [unclassified Chelatococcus]|uniref:winged helix-turn-helix transcriptional regulator n=1 Tax=unclassified Chelatococcus TaxID=2638111 RepID=UPI001BCBC302|nr:MULTISPECIES: helix-turn-helix domain-containing protein [unclassified Chelatococcus]MBS7699788.1 helix-turn-helix transcriptional regulator [Chelatococcus sp. YT9]MBX3558134.1 helix-turn-helix transcriptional regulator [Chelatococcus sp.]